MDAKKVAGILRNKEGLGDADIGLGNEKAMNQFIAHHAVIFKPEERIMWVSTQPNVMGAYMAYDLDDIFSSGTPVSNKSIDNIELEISADPFLQNQKYKKFLEHKTLTETIREHIKMEKTLPDSVITKMIEFNPEYFASYELAGDYYFSQRKIPDAILFYTLALEKEISSESAREGIIEKLNDCI